MFGRVIEDIIAIADPKYDAEGIREHFFWALAEISSESMNDGVRAGMKVSWEMFVEPEHFQQIRAERDYVAICGSLDDIAIKANPDSPATNDLRGTGKSAVSEETP